jgi:hypothetical protein
MHHFMTHFGPDLQFFGLGFAAALVLWALAGQASWNKTGRHPWTGHPGYWVWIPVSWVVAGFVAVLVGHEPAWLAPLAAGAAPASVFAQLTGTSDGGAAAAQTAAAGSDSSSGFSNGSGSGSGSSGGR